ncbi:hypothetical protein [Lentilitoribacter sp. EG35]|uniref:hypothetical protein n=1 Tax=Lentilitoribacter sp. EG35 TaxID=3234192 RepID=UPI00345FD2CB
MPKTNKNDGKDAANQLENLAYIHSMLGELRKVADAEGADMLCYLIEMAYIEAGDIKSKLRPLKSGVENKRNKPSGMSL